MSIRPGMENTSEKVQTKDNSTMAAISDGFSAFHMEVDKVRANMLGSKDTAFSAERAPVTDASQQIALDKAKETNIYASVFNQQGKAPKWNSVDQRMQDIIAA